MKKTPMIISIDAEGALNKIQLPFMMKKTLGKVGIERNVLNLLNTIFKKLIAINIVTSEELTQRFPP
jgi:hypothetical protein